MFDCDPDRLMDFIQLVEYRSNMLGYQDLFVVTDNSDPANPVGRLFSRTMESSALNKFKFTLLHIPSRKAGWRKSRRSSTTRS